MVANRRRTRRRARGFTLLEVLIGLVVLSLALLALTRTAALQVDNLGQLRDRTMAGWLAQDLLAETRIGNPFPPVGKSNGTRRFGPADWRWEVNVQPTQVATIRRIDVRIFADDDRETPLAQLSGLTGQDLLP
ncbi:MAG TPA: type II secretion system minor pseudopilin GspI [Rudaea sp.]|nr:type II secretion system minor pseudopilin GspI [Rudaea sp.]